MSDPRPIAVIGATGAQGGAVVDALIDRGIRPRAVTRDPASRRARSLADRGVEVVGADLADEDALVEAFTGVRGVFAVTTPFEDGTDAEVEQGLHLIAAARRSSAPHLVFSSVASADQHSGVPHFDSKVVIEAALADSGIPYTVVGPTYFFDNLLGGLDQLRAGVFELPLPSNIALQQLSRRDLGRFVATIFSDPGPVTGQRIDIASDALTPQQMASALSRVLARPVRLVTDDPARIRSADMRAMFTFLADRGYAADMTRVHRAFPDVGWQRFDDWLEEIRPVIAPDGAPRQGSGA